MYLNDHVVLYGTQEQVRQLNNPRYRAHILKEAANIWKRMIDLKDTSIRMTDDGTIWRLDKKIIMLHLCLRQVT